MISVNNSTDSTRQDLIELAISNQGQPELRRTAIDGQISVSSEMAMNANILEIDVRLNFSFTFRFDAPTPS